jgi:hypothetical protein
MLNEHRVSLLIQYLDVLQRGRSKPNTQGPGTIYESLHNIPDIEVVKKEINRELNVKLQNHTIEFK